MRPGALFLLFAILISCGQTVDSGADTEVRTRGSLEVTAELVEIRGEFVKKLNYDYAFVMKYRVIEVHRGGVEEEDILYVGHYNPLKPRDQVADARVEEIGGNLKQFRVGDMHRMALEPSIDDHYMGGVINRYFDEGVDAVCWAVWTNPASAP